MMKKQLFLLLIAFILVITACTSHDDKDSISVMSFNIRYNNPEDSINAWSNRVSLIRDLLTNEKPDLIGMQEVLYDQYELLDSLLNEYSSVGVGRNDGAREGELNPVFFRKDRFEQVRTITFWLSETPDVPGSKSWGSSLPRIVTWIELVNIDNHSHFFLFNTHFAHDSDLARIMSSKMIMKYIQDVSAGFPFIITGDFNMNPKSLGYKILTGPDESVPLLRDSFTISGKKPAGPQGTYNGFTDIPNSERIDYIFVRNGMKVKDIKTIMKMENGVYVSDHWPVMANVVLK